MLDPATSEVAVDRVIVVRGDAEEVRRTAAERPGHPIVVLVDAPDRRIVSAMLDAGADGVALKSDGEERLDLVVRAVAAGSVVVPRTGRKALRRPLLTGREKQILGLLVLGMTNAEIAARLYLSESTVKFHLTSVFGKLEVSSRKEAIDAILDPASGLGTGILGITGASRVQSGYGAPGIE